VTGQNPLPRWLAAWAAVILPVTGMAATDKVGTALVCTMSVPAHVAAGRSVPFKFQLANPGKTTLYVLTWNTPLEGFFGKSLAVTGPQGEVAYRGAMVKRGVPAREDYVRIKPGATVSKSLNLATAYDLAATGTYEAAFIGRLPDVTAGQIPRSVDAHVSHELACPVLRFEVRGAEK
jgi:hypothetical protein